MSIKGGGRTLDGKFPFCFWDELTKKKQFTNKPMKWLEIILTMYNRPEQTHLHQEFHCHRRPKLQKAPVHVSLFKLDFKLIFIYLFLGPGPNTKPGSKLCMFLSGSLSSLRIVSKTLIKINIAKGTTDPRVEFILQDHSSQFANLEHITISDSW